MKDARRFHIVLIMTCMSWPAMRVSATESVDHWAFQPPARTTPPVVENATWIQNPIDAFIAAEHARQGLAPADRADNRTLIRRVTFDLTGLPPSPDEVAAFAADDTPEAFATVVDRLLDSPEYGVRWGRHWLDTVRYTDYLNADPLGANKNPLFEFYEAYRYRDWVIDALNADMPYDQFIVHQIAGDLLPNPNGEPLYPEGMIATTVLAIGFWQHGCADKKKLVGDIVDDQIDVIGKALLGLTLACSRCHDHKFDPMTQEDYYGLAGIFYSSRILESVGVKGDYSKALRVPLATPQYLEERQQSLDQLAAVNIELAELKAESNDKADQERQDDIQGRQQELEQRAAEIEQQTLPEPPLAMAIQEGGTADSLFPGIQDVPIHIRGSYARPGKVVPRRMPQFLAGKDQAPINSGSGRLELAHWIASADNPLTTRVIVNRVWQHHFGKGLVGTSNNFGRLGEEPTHPELLDWLTHWFVDHGWSLKKLHRLILLSATYQQSMAGDAGAIERDPDNRFCTRMPSRRLEAEPIRDAMLAVAGQLDLTKEGPAQAELGLPRRSVYIQTRRFMRNLYTTLFDAANPEQPVAQRSVSTTAPQALFLLNNEFVKQQAQALAARLAAEVPQDGPERVQRAYEVLFARPASDMETAIAEEFLSQAADRQEGWIDYAQLLLCSNEFFYVN